MRRSRNMTKTITAKKPFLSTVLLCTMSAFLLSKPSVYNVNASAPFSKTNTRLHRRKQARKMQVCQAFLKLSDVDKNGHLSEEEYKDFLSRMIKSTDEDGSPTVAPGRLEQMMAFNHISSKSSAAKASKVSKPLKEGAASELLGCFLDRQGYVQCRSGEDDKEEEDVALAFKNHIWIGNDDDRMKLQQAQIKSTVRKLRAGQQEATSNDDDDHKTHLAFICGELISLLNKYEFQVDHLVN